MTIEIKSRFNGAVLFSADVASLKLCVMAAVRSGAKLYGADLHGADLYGADLHGAKLYGADLYGADLHGADLYGADLCGADLCYANLRGADLCDANLRYANLRDANLRYANLRDANLHGAKLYGADLHGADLYGADLCGAEGAELAIARTSILPDGDLIGWKKCAGGVIVKLRIPADAKRSHAFGRKCRAEYADVLEVIGADRAKTIRHGVRTIYTPGERVMPDKWDDNWMDECSNGIHFFITRAEAEAY